MKIYLSIIFVLLGLVTFAQNDTVAKVPSKEFVEFTVDFCDCINSSSAPISEDFKRAMIEGALSGVSMDAVMEARVSQDPDFIMKDAEGLLNFSEGMFKCTQKLEKEYGDELADYLGEESSLLMMELMKNQQGCEFGYALFLLGKNAKSQETYLDEEYYDEEYYDEEE